MKDLIQALKSEGFVFTVRKTTASSQGIVEIVGCASSKEAIVIPDGVNIIGRNAFLLSPCVKSITIPASVKLIREDAIPDIQGVLEKIEYLGKECIVRETALSFDALKRLTIRNVNENFASQISLWSLESIVSNSLAIANELSAEDSALLSQVVLKNSRIHSYAFGSSGGAACAFLLENLKEKFSLCSVNKLLTNSINNQYSEVTAMLLEYKQKTFTRAEIDSFDEEEYRVKAGFEAPTFEQLQANFDCQVTSDIIEISEYKGEEFSIVIPSRLRDGRIVAKVSDIRCEDLISDVVVDGVGEIGQGCFFGNYCLERVYIKEGTYWVGEKAFTNCGTLSEITLPRTLKVMHLDSLSGTNVSSVTIPCKLDMVISDAALYSFAATAHFQPSETVSTIIEVNHVDNILSYWSVDAHQNKTEIQFDNIDAGAYILRKVL